MKRRFVPLLAFLVLLPGEAWAQRHFNVPGVQRTIFQVLGNLIGVLVTWIVALAVTLFLVGAAMMVGGAANEQARGNGKKIMIGSLVGMAITLLAAVIIRFIYFVLY